MSVDYDIGEIMDALAATFNGVETGDEVNGVPVTITCSAEVTGQVMPPAIVLDLDEQELDLDMGHGADAINITAAVMVQYQDMAGSQRALWSFLSRKTTSGITRLTAALEANQTLGGLVSYAIMRRVRNIGLVTFSGVEYLGAEIVIEVMS